MPCPPATASDSRSHRRNTAPEGSADALITPVAASRIGLSSSDAPAAVEADTVASMSAVWKYVDHPSGNGHWGTLIPMPVTWCPSFEARI